MAGKAVISLTTGLEDPEKVTVALLVAVGAAEAGRPTLIFSAKEAVRLALDGTAAGVACEGCPSLPDLLSRYEKAGGRYMVCPICFNAKNLDKGMLLPNAELAGTVQLWEWIGEDAATPFSYGGVRTLRPGHRSSRGGAERWSPALLAWWTGGAAWSSRAGRGCSTNAAHQALCGPSPSARTRPGIAGRDHA